MPIIKTHNYVLRGRAGPFDITLRPMSDADLPLLYKWNADPEVLYWSETNADDISHGYSRGLVNWIYGSASQNALCFIILADGFPIGECWLAKMELPLVLRMYPVTSDIRRIDMSIGEKRFWGKGIGTAMIGLLVNFAFLHEQADVLHCICGDYNMRSRRVWEKNGFKHVLSTPLDPAFTRGKNEYHYCLTRVEFLQRSAAPRQIRRHK